MNYIAIGRIHSTQGLRGELFVQVFSGEAVWADQWDQLLLADKESDAPTVTFEIAQRRPHRKKNLFGFAVKVAGKDKIEDVEPLVGQSVFVPGEFLKSSEGEAIFLREILEFSVIDRERGAVGRVVDFFDNTAQDLVVIEDAKGIRFEVPLVEPLLVKIDFDAKIVHMDIPQGLVAGEDL